MAKFSFTKRVGEVKSFDEDTGRGKIIVGKNTYGFEATSFRSDRPVRHPRVGEVIEAVLSEESNRLVSVWSLSTAHHSSSGETGGSAHDRSSHRSGSTTSKKR